jgi:hypothetical protein
MGRALKTFAEHQRGTVVSTLPDPLPQKDRVILGLLLFYLLLAFTWEIYFVLYHDQLPARAEMDFMGRMCALYGEADRTYYDPVSPFTLSLESIQVFFSSWLNIWLIYAILKRKHYRHTLQLTVSSYLTYSVILYFLVAHVSGYAGMKEKDFAHFALFFGPNLPWLFGHAYMAYDSILAINQRMRRETEETANP